ncbi:hypothetical protein F4V57_12170 [Acinetobacter qingfengensis]|nr:hypothetical protein [Acinetobacter qingfengensis]KAA8731667.1 hypothetical protein F4V57_12170 [Acinetobacter qingfengensis]
MSNHTQSNKTVWMIFAAICGVFAIAALIYFAYSSLNSPSQQKETAVNPSAKSSNQNTTSNTDAMSLQATNSASTAQPASIDQTFNALVQNDLDKQPLPENPALAKDELQQLADVQKQLHEQKQLLQQQHQSADRLIELKQQQIADLQQQLKN